MTFTNVHTNYRGTVWGTNNKGENKLLCRKCQESEADFFISNLSTYDEKEGWLEEWHMCKSCVRNWQNERDKRN